MPDNNQKLPQMIPLRDVAESLHVTPEFLYKEINGGKLVAYKYARSFYVRLEDLEEYLEKRKVAAKPDEEKEEEEVTE